MVERRDYCRHLKKEARFQPWTLGDSSVMAAVFRKTLSTPRVDCTPLAGASFELRKPTLAGWSNQYVFLDHFFRRHDISKTWIYDVSGMARLLQCFQGVALDTPGTSRQCVKLRLGMVVNYAFSYHFGESAHIDLSWEDRVALFETWVRRPSRLLVRAWSPPPRTPVGQRHRYTVYVTRMPRNGWVAYVGYVPVIGQWTVSQHEM